jgi:hypothetical protein
MESSDTFWLPKLSFTSIRELRAPVKRLFTLIVVTVGSSERIGAKKVFCGY